MDPIIPAVLEEQFAEIEKKIKIYSQFTDTIHIDFIDGIFDENKTFLIPAPFLAYANKLTLEAHLMVDEPIKYLKPLSGAGFKRFFGHIERMSDQAEFVAEGQLLGEIGLALDIDTPIDGIEIPLEDLDAVLLMSIKAGVSGREFDPRVLEKIQDLSVKTFIPLEVDGGINSQTIKLAKTAGAERFCVNNFLLKGNPKEQYQKLLKELG